jgi:hypothetical protein
MRHYDGARNEQPEANAVLPYALAALQRLEDPWQHTRRNGRTAVMDLERHRIALLWRVRVMGVPSPCWIALPMRFDTTCANRSRSQWPRTSPMVRLQWRFWLGGADFKHHLVAHGAKVGVPPRERDCPTRQDSCQVQ